VTIPVGSYYGYFDLVGLTSATPDTRLYYPAAVTVAANGDIFVADTSNYRVRKLSNGVLSTVAGNGATSANLGATALTTALEPRGVIVDGAGNLYVSSENGHVVYQITPAGAISIVAGTQNSAQFEDGAPGVGNLYSPHQVAMGADGSLYIADYNNHRVRKVPFSGGVFGAMITIAGGGATPPAAGVAATAADFGRISGVAVDPASNEVYFTDYDGHRVWKFSQADGLLVLIAGTGDNGFNGDNGDATLAQLYYPLQLNLHGTALYIADYYNHRVRKVTTNASPRPLVTVAGTTSAGFNGDGDLGILSRLYYPSGVATDASGDLLIADTYNHRIREVLASDSRIQTVIGNGSAGFSGDGLPGRGVTITASIAPGGPNHLPGTVGVNVAQSSWEFTSTPTSSTGPTFDFTVRQTSSVGSGMRMNSSTTFSLTPNTANVLSLPANLTIPNNGTSILGTATTIGSGITQIIAQASPTGIALGATSNITVTPVVTNVAPNSGGQGTTNVTITGRNLLGATGITTTATGVSAAINNVSANGQTMTATITVGQTATPGAKTLTINTPTGNVDFTFTVN
jgi:hypothetical protein